VAFKTRAWQSSPWPHFEIAKTGAIRAFTPDEPTFVRGKSHLDAVAEALQVSKIEAHSLAILVSRWIGVSAVAVFATYSAIAAMNGVLGLILPRDIAAFIGRVFLRPMTTDNFAADLIDPPLSIGVWCGVNVLLTHVRTPTSACRDCKCSTLPVQRPFDARDGGCWASQHRLESGVETKNQLLTVHAYSNSVQSLKP
jgi:hypothetical protein